MDKCKEAVFFRHNEVDALTVIVTASTRPVRAQARQKPRLDEGSGHKVPPVAEQLLAFFDFWESGGLFSSVG